MRCVPWWEVVTKRRCPAAPVKYVGLTGRTPCHPWIPSITGSKEVCETERETISSSRTWVLFKRQSLGLFYKSWTLSQTQFSWYCVLFYVVWNHFRNWFSYHFQSKTQTRLLVSYFNVWYTRLLLTCCLCLSTLDPKWEKVWFTLLGSSHSSYFSTN